MIAIGISDDAVGDLEEGFWFYESQEEGLGDYFSSSLASDIEGLKVTADIHRVCYREFRRIFSRIFPYAIYYTLTGKRAVIWAVVDCRRDPEWIKEHLDGRS